MASFTIQPLVVDADSLEVWKKAWLEIWRKERLTPTVLHKRPGSEWVMEDTDIPWCPFHFNYCILDESMMKIKDWNH